MLKLSEMVMMFIGRGPVSLGGTPTATRNIFTGKW